MKKKRPIAIGTISIALIFLSQQPCYCQSDIPEVDVGKVVDNLFSYEGKMIILKGKFEGYGGAAITKSDWQICDNNKCIYTCPGVEIEQKDRLGNKVFDDYMPVRLRLMDRESYGEEVRVKGEIEMIKNIEGKRIPYIVNKESIYYRGYETHYKDKE
jgi:hypothetical protein